MHRNKSIPFWIGLHRILKKKKELEKQKGSVWIEREIIVKEKKYLKNDELEAGDLRQTQKGWTQ